MTPLFSASSFVNLMGAYSTTKQLVSSLGMLDESDKGVSGVGVPPADAPKETTPGINPNAGKPGYSKDGIKIGSPEWWHDLTGGILQGATGGAIGDLSEEGQKAYDEAFGAGPFRQKFDNAIRGLGLRALFIFGGAFLTGLGVIFILREARPDQTAEFGDKLADALTKEKD